MPSVSEESLPKMASAMSVLLSAIFGGQSTLVKTCLILYVSLQILTSSVHGNPFGEHRCFNMTPSCAEEICQCSCDRMEIPPLFEVSCPSQTNNIRMQFVPGQYFKIDCKTENDEFVHLPFMDIGDVESVAIKGCKMPAATPLMSILNRFGIRNVKTLFLANDNKDFPFRREHFKGMNLMRFSLSTPGLTELPDDFFDEIANITWLEIKNSKLQRVRTALLKLTQLKTLEISGNALTQLEAGGFETLKNLDKLSVWSNQLQSIGKDDFRGLDKVTMVDLLGNKIETIHPDAFLPLVSLKYIGLNKNNFHELPEGIFRANAHLEEAKLTYNNVSRLPAGLFANIPALTLIKFTSAGLTDLPEDTFANSTGIQNISLDDNRISVLPAGIFQNLSSMQLLDLRSNEITDLPDGLLNNLRQLRHLDLSFNNIESFHNGLFRDLVNLQNLYMKNNRLQTLSSRMFDFTVNLRVLDLSNNLLNFSHTTIYNDVPQSPLQKLKRLESLNLRNNSIEIVHSDFSILMTQLKQLDLSYNQITFVQYQHLQFHGNGIEVDLSNNQISDVDFGAFEEIARAQSAPPRHPPIINMEDNPLECHCNVLYFAKFLQNKYPIDVASFLRIRADSLTCTEPERLRGRPLRFVDPMELICSFKSYAETNQSCPSECTCDLRLADQSLIVNCSNAGLRSVPQLPTATKLNYSFTILHIDNNNLESLPTAVALPGYSEVREVYAQGNNISHIEPENIPDRLEVIDLSNNNIQSLSEATMRKINATSSVRNMRLSHNLWTCQCEMRDVLSFMQSNYKRISDYSTLECINGDEISRLSTSDICPQELQSIIILSTILTCLGIFAGVLAALYYKYQQEIKIWMYWHNILPFLFNSDVLDNDKKYDAFISYSHKDEDFITDQLMPELEQKRRFNLCIHRRDWTPGDFIPEQIVRSVSESRRTLIVLSPNYVESVWGTMEFRTAHRSAMEDQVSRVIVIVYGKVDRETLDPELKSYIDMNTYIEWGDPWFWERLHYALRTIQAKKVDSGTGLKKSQLKSSVDDKLELIHPSPISSPLTTPPAEHPLNYKQNGVNGHVNGAFIINTNSKQSDV